MNNILLNFVIGQLFMQQSHNALTETAYLLQSPKNAERLNQAVADFKSNNNYKKIDIL